MNDGDRDSGNISSVITSGLELLYRDICATILSNFQVKTYVVKHLEKDCFSHLLLIIDGEMETSHQAIT